MYTSNYARLRRIPKDLRPVAISRRPPRWYTGEVMLDLAPTSDMLKMCKADYDVRFAEILAKLDPQETYDKLGENSVLLCFESPNDWCHRRAVAEWFETHLGIVVPEYGFERSFSVPYASMPG